MAEKKETKSVAQIERDLAQHRKNLAGIVDELAYRTQPKEIAKRSVENAKLAATDKTHDSNGELATTKLASALGGAGGLLLLLGLVRRATS